jgi:hypothetical protein
LYHLSKVHGFFFQEDFEKYISILELLLMISSDSFKDWLNGRNDSFKFGFDDYSNSSCDINSKLFCYLPCLVVIKNYCTPAFSKARAIALASPLSISFLEFVACICRWYSIFLPNQEAPHHILKQFQTL